VVTLVADILKQQWLCVARKRWSPINVSKPYMVGRWSELLC